MANQNGTVLCTGTAEIQLPKKPAVAGSP